jgi:NAD(P)-dependent dehydrogenase (short-subunit alcohol dehydrogenase family)
MPLENRTAVITGASGGIGTVLTQDLAALKVNLALLERSGEKLETLIHTLGLPGAGVYPQAVDLVDPAATRAAAGMVAARFKHVDILLHLVGGWMGGKNLADSPAADLEMMIDQHIWTTFNLIQAFVPHLVKNGWGRIIMITSPSATAPNARGGPYAVGKAGQEALMLALSQELKGSGVTANLLQVKTIDVKREKLSNPSADNASWTTPEELSAAVQYLLSDTAGSVNGAKLPLFGGYR